MLPFEAKQILCYGATTISLEPPFSPTGGWHFVNNLADLCSGISGSYLMLMNVTPEYPDYSALLKSIHDVGSYGEPIPPWNRLWIRLFWYLESPWNRLQKNWNRNTSIFNTFA